ncbi:MAG: NAD-dependent epimerase/dehydratase family protein [Verrucomicrobia bacterium]|nr:NAD-dependent epimerase/dehydratase family protein [Verrucomicrobiota bacterium]
MSVLVTGGTGFLGRNLVERLLRDGRTVAILGRTPAPDLQDRGVRFIQASLDDAEAVRAACAGIETVFHTAAKVGVWGRHADFHRTNVLGTRALLAGCRANGVAYLVHTSTPSVVYNGRDLANADESLPLTTSCPSPYPLTKAIAERDVLAANSPSLRTVALRPHLIWGVGDPHLVPRVIARARAGRLRIIGSGQNLVDMVHIENAVEAQLLAEAGLRRRATARAADPAGRAYFITNGEPVRLWDWINGLLAALRIPPVTRRVPLGAAYAAGACCEAAWRLLPLRGEPPLTRFIAAELAKDHWFDLTAARRDLGYTPWVTMADGTAALVDFFRQVGA